MLHSEFSIGQRFTLDGYVWQCTDVGTRTIAAIEIGKDKDHIKYDWLAGPPYALAEIVFDEYDMPACEELRGFEEAEREN